MKSIFKAAAGAVIAVSASLAAAQSTTITFESPIAPIEKERDAQNLADNFGGSATYKYYFNFATQGYTFYSKDDVGEWSVLPSGGFYKTGTTPGWNISGLGPGDGTQAFGSWAFSSSSGTPFTFQGFEGCCAPIVLQLSPVAGPAIYVGWDGNNFPADGLLGPTQKGTYVETLFNNIPLNEVAFWSLDNNFAVDNIKVTLVPEPSSYALMLAGIGAMAFVVRRRKAQTQV